MKARYLLTLLVALAGCDGFFGPIDDEPCSSKDDAVTLSSFPVEIGPETVTFEIHGTAQHKDGFTIRRVTVAGIDATPTNFNYSLWTVSVPVSLLPITAESEAQDLTLAVVAYDSCDSSARGAGEARVHFSGPSD